MKRITLLLCTLCTAFLLQAQHQKIEDARIITEDIDRFWEAFDRADPKFSARHFVPYIKEGTPGLQDFLPNRIQNARKLSGTIRKRSEDYRKVREGTTKMKVHEAVIRKVYQKLGELYPEAVYPDVYFVIGRFSSGGTSSRSGLIIGAEHFGSMEKDAATGHSSYDWVPGIVAHELIHFQQNYPLVENVLGQCLVEGAADFLGKLIYDQDMTHHLDGYAKVHEEELWKEFEHDKYTKNFKNWMYAQPKDKNRPADLGYWIGFQLVKAYYEKHPDKKQAIHDILNIKDFDEFLGK